MVVSHTECGTVLSSRVSGYGVLNLIDSFDHAIDGKGRIVLPSAFRDRFAGGAVLSSKSDHLACYTPDAWAEFLEVLRATRREGHLTRTEFNLIAGLSSSVKPDAQGRVMLSSRMRQSVGLEQNVIIQGADDYIAIYPADAWQREGVPTIAEVSAKIDRLGL